MSNKYIFSCVILWILVEFISFVASKIRKNIEATIYKNKKSYINHLLYFLEKNVPKQKLLQELYYSFPKNRILQSLILKSMKKGDLRASLAYIEGQIWCYPVARLHEIFLSSDYDVKAAKQEVDKAVNSWDMSRNGIKTAYRKNRIRLIVERTILFLSTIALHSYHKNEISLLIFAVVNTIGVILFIVLDYESINVDLKIRDGNPARGFNTEKKTLAPALGLKNIFQLAGCMGLIINIAMIAAQFLEQAI